jgi:DNA (cytosine-5)-methyltransferase 1
MHSPKPFTVVSLFSGAGGFDLGFHQQGFDVIWANDNNKDACATHRCWSSSQIVQKNINQIPLTSIPYSDVIIGGFPCQGFSLAGPRKIDDTRNSLYKAFVKLVEEKQPLCFVAENVKGLLTLGQGKIAEAILDDFSSKGYDVKIHQANAKNYGIAQDRARIFIIGFRKDLSLAESFEFPKPTNEKFMLVDALKDLPIPDPSDVCNAPFSSRYLSRNRKRDWDQVSFTIPATAKQITLHPSSPNMQKIKSESWSFGVGVTRRLSWQEASSIQSFPKDFYFVGNLTSKYKQIGNAVPPKLAGYIAQAVQKSLASLFSPSLESYVDAKTI